MLGESEEIAGTSGAPTAYVAELDSDEDGGGGAAPIVPDVLETRLVVNVDVSLWPSGKNIRALIVTWLDTS